VNRNKDQGTDWQREVLERCTSAGLKAWTLAEHGSKDQGDICIRVGGEHVIAEAKCRSNLTVHPAVGLANSKAKHPSGEFPARFAFIAWKRLVATDGPRRRQPGKPVAVLDLDDLLWLLTRVGKVRLRD